jgi:alginate O-acetyltransferase complex protein AlgI
MVFTSSSFLFLFLPAFILAQCYLPYKNLSFVVFSTFFYFVGEGWFTSIAVFSILINFVFGLAIDSSQNLNLRRIWLAAAVVSNLAVLVIFKYAGFISVTLFDPSPGSWAQSIHLPLGISFITFHAISYIIDIYRANARAERSLLKDPLIFRQCIHLRDVAVLLNRGSYVEQYD